MNQKLNIAQGKKCFGFGSAQTQTKPKNKFKNQMKTCLTSMASLGNGIVKFLLVIATLFVASTVSRASSDYGPAYWRPCYPGHYYTSGYGHKFVVIHDMEGYYLTTISYFKRSSTQASVHYFANGKKDYGSDAPAGEISQGVREAYYAWHVGCWNRRSLGTEHEGFASHPAWYTDAMYRSSAALQKHLCNKFGIAKDRNHVVGHNAWQSSAWRSYARSHFGIDPSCNNHTDPGPYWNWTKFMSLVRS